MHKASVFERFRLNTYGEAGCKPYVIAAMILLAKVRNPVDALRAILARATPLRTTGQQEDRDV